MNKQLKTKNILVTGGSGFIGSNFLKYLNDRKLDYKIISPSHRDLDILNKEQLKKNFDIFKPDVVINFAAHRDANSAEFQRNDLEGSVWQINVKGVENIFNICQEYGSFLIHLSTDMVFSGSEDNKGLYDERNRPELKLDNLSWYGWTKAQAENILANNAKTAIIRIGNVTQPIYDPKLDYVGKILYLFDCDKLYPLFDDQYLTLSYIPSILEVIEKLIIKKSDGVFHVASKNVFTPYILGEYLIRKARGKSNVVKRLSMNEYLKKSPNRYPQYGGLLAEKTNKELQIKPLYWEEIVDLYIDKTEGYFFTNE